jgi:transcriptional regulator with XRE-family HTH domain
MVGAPDVAPTIGGTPSLLCSGHQYRAAPSSGAKQRSPYTNGAGGQPLTAGCAAYRKQMGEMLCRMRGRSGMRLKDAAAVLGCSQATLSRLENGFAGWKVEYVRRLVEAYGPEARSSLADLEALLVAAGDWDWTCDFSDAFSQGLLARHLSTAGGGRFARLEQDLVHLESYEPYHVPGLLQTREYADQVCRDFYPGLRAHQRDLFTAFRQKRQQVLLKSPAPPRVRMIMSEAVLYRRGAMPSALLCAQLRALLDRLQGEWAWIEFRLALLGSEPAAAVGGPFYIMRFGNRRCATVYLEGRESSDYLEQDWQVGRYTARYKEIADASLSPEATLERIADAASFH